MPSAVSTDFFSETVMVYKRAAGAKSNPLSLTLGLGVYIVAGRCSFLFCFSTGNVLRARCRS
jgi:hypothetical protein